MRRHLPRLFECAPVLQVGGDTGAAESVVAHFGGDAGRPHAPAHHLPGVDPIEPLAVKLRLAGAVWSVFDGLEEGDPPRVAQPATLDVLAEISLERVVAGHFVELSALLVEPHPQPALLVEDVAHVQAAGRGDAGEGQHHDPNQRPIQQSQHAMRVDGA
jgi:hypothetical protein